jgi:acetyl/propionyl-CoA carboxylase alpha subunit
LKRLLIANRGEIAMRIARTARRMGISTVAIHSDADAQMPHVRACDTAVRLGPAPSRDSYLNVPAILEAARKSGADAVHPGYGFLSENATFARAVIDAGLIFVGPRTETIEGMGDKARAKRIAADLGLPVLFGYDGDDQSDGRLRDEAARIGYPLILKAAAGGGGRGMRVVREPGDFADAVDSARREAEAAFGDARLLIERLVEDARHVEVQVFGDTSGNVVHLFDRDCSAQRRHQKLVEEAPSPAVSDTLRQWMTGDAVNLARAVGYVGAGTVEFVVGADGRHHFLEMNTRLQVEHPVTEAITGLDLVEWQLRVARGEKLPLTQDRIAMRGHAIEVRLCAEDAAAGFLPQTGRIAAWQPAPGARIEAGVETGSVVSPHYDSMIAKLIVDGADRAEAVARMVAALDATHIAGVVTNRGFLRGLVDSAEFREAAVTTSLLDRWTERASHLLSDAPPALARPVPDLGTVALAAAILGNAVLGDTGGDWFRSSGVADCPIDLEGDGRSFACRLKFERGALAAIQVDGERSGIEAVSVVGNDIAFTADGVQRRAWHAFAGNELWLDLDGKTFRFREIHHLIGRAAVQDGSRVVAPLSGVVRKVHVSPGDTVETGAPLVVIEAMKMEIVLSARAAGTVRAVHATEGAQVAAGSLLVELDTDA